MYHNILTDPDIINATLNTTANATATTAGVAMTIPELDMLKAGFGAMALVFIALAMDG